MCRRRLWRVVGSSGTQAPDVYVVGPPDDPLFLRLPAADPNAVRSEIRWMVRLIDVGGRRWPPAGTRDRRRSPSTSTSPTPMRRGTPGGGCSRSPAGQGQLRRGGAGTVQTTVNGLSSLWAGYASAHTLAAAGLPAVGAAPGARRARRGVRRPGAGAARLLLRPCRAVTTATMRRWPASSTTSANGSRGSPRSSPTWPSSGFASRSMPGARASGRRAAPHPGPAGGREGGAPARGARRLVLTPSSRRNSRPAREALCVEFAGTPPTTLVLDAIAARGGTLLRRVRGGQRTSAGALPRALSEPDQPVQRTDLPLVERHRQAGQVDHIVVGPLGRRGADAGRSTLGDAEVGEALVERWPARRRWARP